MKILVAGAAGFIGNELALHLTARGDEVTGIDNLNNYYDVSLKQARLDRLKDQAKFKFIKLDISDRTVMANLFEEHDFDVVVNLAAQAGVRYSLQNPDAYIDSNLVGFANILEDCLSKKAKLNMPPMQNGDVKATFANVEALNELLGFKPSTPIETGLHRFVEWYRQYYK